MLTVAELPEFIRIAERLLSPEERFDLVHFLALHPKDGDLMVGTGGVRKLRWRRGDHGKSGGVRVIYYFHNRNMPLYLLTIFAKGERSNLTKAERDQLALLTAALVSIWTSKGKSHDQGV